jgi:hydrogenase nickel incorporation protein HypA/HybF
MPARIMHEVSVIQNVLELVRQQLADEEPVRVTAIRLRVGPLAGVVADALRFAFDGAVTGTPLAGARLDIEAVSLTAWCRHCLAERDIATPQRLVCPVCEQPTPDLISGKDLELAWLEDLELKEATAHES